MNRDDQALIDHVAGYLAEHKPGKLLDCIAGGAIKCSIAHMAADRKKSQELDKFASEIVQLKHGAEWISTKDAALIAGVNEQRIRALCEQDRIVDKFTKRPAEKVRPGWRIPKEFIILEAAKKTGPKLTSKRAEKRSE